MDKRSHRLPGNPAGRDSLVQARNDELGNVAAAIDDVVRGPRETARR
jgi:hypothetical protein